MAMHSGKKEFYERIHQIEKGETEKQIEKKMKERQNLMSHKYGTHQIEERINDGR